MQYVLLFTLAALAAGRPDNEQRPKPHPRPPYYGPAIMIRPYQMAPQNETYEFKFGIAGMKPLNESEVHLYKVKKGEKGPELENTDFEISLKTLTEEEIKEWIEKHRDEWKDKDDEKRPWPKPHPRPHPRVGYLA